MQVGSIVNIPPDRRTYEGNDFPLPHNKIGVEVEVERVRTGIREIEKLGTWRTTPEGSLREHGVEFVFREPLFGKDAEQAIRDLMKTIGDIRERRFKDRNMDTLFRFSHRTSIHVHVDVRDMNPNDLFSFLYNYIIFERLMFRWIQEQSGIDRSESPFCVPYYCSPDEYTGVLSDLLDLERVYNKTIGDTDGDEIMAMEQVQNSIHHIFSRGPRYLAVNFSSLLNMGTLEFRQLHGTDNPDVILKWIHLILHLKRHALENREPPEYTLMRISADPNAYLQQVFGSLWEELEFPDTQWLLYSGVRKAQGTLLLKSIHRTSNSIRRTIDSASLLDNLNTRLKRNSSE